ncbi:Hsp20/alpha crystallin family protein [Amycolatopsis acidiphila]|uniref:Hsp20/alpha crystallin family protein n=1 Tax=Amycolatopsis acidiphila TaxID=715473 RepID=UPI001E60E2B6|nr:Hsp20/alpha crystallin family protein [Amycolatopsis acidiphila]UIJ57625.1 Hsp20/alpha crystallin family protein [Amycolatopsis acidiphila]
MSGAPAGAAWMPAADVTENDDEYVIEIELPGVHGDDIAVEANGRELVVSGEIKEKERKGILRRRTRRIGSFEFRTTLPGEIDVEHIDAKLSNGILTVHVPKNERSKRHKVKIVEG